MVIPLRAVMRSVQIARRVRCIVDRLARTVGLSISIVMLLSASAQAGSGDRIGDAVTIVNTVMADFDKQQRTLATGDDVRQDEVIEVSADARGELKLDDDTKLALGPGSRLVLDTFVYDSEKKAGTIAIDLAKGAFRFITGVASKPTYVIKTPNASITVRGTIFDVYILPDETVWLLLHEGAVEVTGRKSACRVLNQPGRLIRISNTGRVGKAVDWSKLDGVGSTAFETAFPFIDQPPQIDPRPILTRATVVNGTLPDAPEEACQNTRPTKIQRANLGNDDGPRGVKAKRRSVEPRVEKVQIAPKVREAKPKRAPKPDKVRETKVRDKPVRVRVETDNPRPIKTAKRPRRPDDDGKAARALGIAIGIGIGIGGGFGRGNRGGGDYGGRRSGFRPN